MGGQNNWRAQVNFGDWMSQVEKRVLSEERRPMITLASEILGPGSGPYAVNITDWNSEAATFVGVFYSTPEEGQVNSPIDTASWIGETFGIQEGAGFQRLTRYDPLSVSGGSVYIRRWYDSAGLKIFGPWEKYGGTPIGTMIHHFGAGPSDTLPCDGGVDYLIDDYPVLAAKMIAAGIPGSTATTFRTPDMTDGRFLRGAPNAGEGNRGGANEVNISEGNMPSHTHSAGSLGVLRGSGTGSAANRVAQGNTTAISDGGMSGATGSTGGGNPLNIVPQYLNTRVSIGAD